MGGPHTSAERPRFTGRTCVVCRRPLSTHTGSFPQKTRICDACERATTPTLHPVLLTFQSDVRQLHGYAFHFLAADARTPLSRWYHVRSAERLRAFLLRMHPTPAALAEYDRSLETWNCGTIRLLLTPQQFASLRR